MGPSLASVGWPVLDRFHIAGDFAISPHGIGIAVGFLLGSWWTIREGPKRGVSEQHLSQALFWALVGAVVGSRLFFVIGHFSEFDGFFDMLAIWRGGLTLIGGIAGAVILGYLVIRRHGYRFFQALDTTYLGFPFGIAVGRIGDLIIADHLGKPTSWFLAWTYQGGELAAPFSCVPAADPTVCTASLHGGHTMEITREGARLFDASGALLQQGVGVHQAALYDLLFSTALFLFLFWFTRRAVRREGVPILVFAVAYGAMRLVFDAIRIDKRFIGLTGSQWTSAAVVTVSIALLAWWAIRKPPDPGRVVRRPGEEAPTTAFTPPPEPGTARGS